MLPFVPIISLARRTEIRRASLFFPCASFYPVAGGNRRVDEVALARYRLRGLPPTLPSTSDLAAALPGEPALWWFVLTVRDGDRLPGNFRLAPSALPFPRVVASTG